MAGQRVIIIGGGIGGLTAALDLALAGVAVTVLEKEPAAGGKMRQVAAGPFLIDSGPTVFTMRWVFDALLADAGTTLENELTLTRATILARHAWGEDERLDLHADLDASADAIAAFAGPDEARRFRVFSAEAATIFNTLKATYLEAPRPTPVSLSRRIGLHRPAALFAIKPFETLWTAIGRHLRDPRLRQLFGRYATYSGSSPFLSPATLMLIAHVEQQGVWLIDGGMQKLAEMLQRLAGTNGAVFRFSTSVNEIHVENSRAAGVTLSTGERLDADAILCNADTAALAAGIFGAAARRAVKPLNASDRSLSAVTWTMAAATSGFDLERHTVFFSGDSKTEFAALATGKLPEDPTIYVCAAARPGALKPGAAEPLLILTNAPARGDSHPLSPAELDACATRTMARLAASGLTLKAQPDTVTLTAPADFNRLFPATGGALYGRASHGWMAAFQRPGAASAIPGLYLAGGSAHPGAGVPMAAQSGRLAAAQLLADLASTRPSGRAVISGGISTAPATTVKTRSR